MTTAMQAARNLRLISMHLLADPVGVHDAKI
jgi:hypothetical protein